VSNINVSSGDSVSIKVVSTSTNAVTVKDSSVNVSVTGVIASTSGDKNYVHDQSSASDAWSVTHNLNKRPAVSVVDSAGTQIICDVQYVSDNEVTLAFDDATAGKAYFN